MANFVGGRKTTSEPINFLNMKPFRTKEQKELARNSARKDKDGAWRSNAPVSFHARAKTQD